MATITAAVGIQTIQQSAYAGPSQGNRAIGGPVINVKGVTIRGHLPTKKHYLFCLDPVNRSGKLQALVEEVKRNLN